MEVLNSVLREFFAGLLHPLSRVPIVWSLLLVSALAAVVALLVFEGLSNKSARNRAARRLWANLLAIRLFADDPRLVAQSFGAVAAANAALLACAIPSFVVLTPLFLLSYGYLDAFFGSSPLSVGNPRVLNVRLSHLGSRWPEISLRTPSWITVDSPPVHVLEGKEISWRILATQAARGTVKIIAGSEVEEKTIDSRPGPQYFSLARMQSFAGVLRYPGEKRLPPGLVAEINVLGPAPLISCFGISLEWTWWFGIFSLLLTVPVKWVLDKCMKHLR